ncbi:serine hydrolase domain-containing protein [Neolewinella lacunae]|uniref:Beta-lactamase family protein n=1 Tax=Neolewinella lacunae TaxID=1517758 RepID=A0A923PPN9_9BACT|nr:serine hydrolase domain-containing protein [Neolewinella lacunae]MBC6996576.1 beta-lactamase family protein [Neolewinella lacunae]MDN3634860.1 serine hydrolase domain-containing protein [Neolewinella lacunae]
MKSSLLLFFFLVFTSFSVAQTASAYADYEAYLKEGIATGQFAGAVTLLEQKGKTLYRAAHGFADQEAGKPMQQDQVFHLMSMTKPIVAVAFMMLYEEGHFQLDDKVSDYLPAFKELRVAKDPNVGKDGETVPATAPVTIRQVLSHTAGFSHGLSGTNLDNDVARALYYAPHENIASRVQALAELPLTYQPGERWFYSASPDIEALLIEKFSGQTVAEFLQQRIFDPLGMKDTGYNLTAEQAARLAKLYKIVDGKLVNDPMQMGAMGNKVFGGTHGLLSTADDYAKFCRMLLGNGRYAGKRLLKKKTLELMTQNHLGDIPYSPGQGFGLGFGLDTAVPEDGLGAAGRYYWSGAYSTFFFVDPANQLFAILMTQRSPYTGQIGDALRKHVYQAISKK